MKLQLLRTSKKERKLKGTHLLEKKNVSFSQTAP